MNTNHINDCSDGHAMSEATACRQPGTADDGAQKSKERRKRTMQQHQWESTFAALDRLMAQSDDESTVAVMERQYGE